MARRSEPLKCVTLFSGCGGLDLGLRKSGFEIIFSNDLDSVSCDSYEDNFDGAHLHRGSVSELKPALLRRVSKGEAVRGGVDLLAGGPPCPPYSKSRFYRKEKPRALADPIGEETLVGYIEALRRLLPRAFLFENVAGFAYDVHRAAYDHLRTTAESLGYNCTDEVLNAADYGVPQIRQRFFMVGVRDGKFAFPTPTHRDPDKRGLFDDGVPPWMTAGEVLNDLDTEENAADAGHFAGGQFHPLLRQIPPGDNYLYFTKERGHPDPVFRWRSRYWSFLLKLSPTLPSWTIQARRSNNMGPFHWRNRILRIEEVKRLQTFPDDWKLHGTIEQQWRQVGNAVPPRLARHLGTQFAARCQTAATHDGGRNKAKAPEYE